MPDVSVVMSIYNDPEFLEESICSILEQDVDLELILVDDGSTDSRVGDVLCGFEEISLIRIHHKENAGLTRALVDGCEMAKGTYIARLDVGDVMTRGRLQAQMELFNRNPTVSLVTGATEYCSPDLAPLYLEVSDAPGKVSLHDGAWIADVNPREDGGNLLAGPTSHSSVMFRRDAYLEAGGYRPSFRTGQDWDLWYRLACLGLFAGLDRTVVRNRLLPESISSGNLQFQRTVGDCSLAAYWARRTGRSEDDILDQARALHQVDYGKSRRAKAAGGHYFIASLCQRAGLGEEALFHGVKAAGLCPWNFKYLGRVLSIRLNRGGWQ